jgi:hypothetical protein
MKSLWLLGQFRANQPLGATRTGLAPALMRPWSTTAGGAPALSQPGDKRQAHRKPPGNLRLTLFVRDWRVDDALE